MSVEFALLIQFFWSLPKVDPKHREQDMYLHIIVARHKQVAAAPRRVQDMVWICDALDVFK